MAYGLELTDQLTASRGNDPLGDGVTQILS
jgi:hypothetical protein